MTKKKKNDINKENIIDINYEDEMAQSYIDYAMSVIGDRALPDVRDGLKPVQRRILYTMNELNNFHDKPFKKSARIVGDTMGKYHPHGDCLRANTKVLLANGQVKTIEELFIEGKDQNVLSIDKNGNIVQAKAHSFRIGQKTNTIYRIVLENGFVIETTNNHPFLNSNLKYVKAEKLKIYDELYTLKQNQKLVSYAKNNLKISSIQIKNVIKENMYDFTVDKYENMLIVASDKEDTFISVHNSSIYDAMARMTQDFIIPNPLVEGHGNFGSIDGDKPAAARYCVTGDTLVNTEKGLKRIDTIVPNLEIYSEQDIDITIESIDGLNKAVKVFNSGPAEIYQIITESGYSIKGSFNHPIIISKTGKIEDIEWKLLSDIKKGDLVLLKTNTLKNTVDNMVLTEKDIDSFVDNTKSDLDILNLEQRKEIFRARNIEQNVYLAKIFNKFAFITNDSIVLRGHVQALREFQTLLLNKGILSNFVRLDINRALLKIYGYHNLLVFYKKIGFMMNNKIKHLDIDLKDIKKDTEGPKHLFVPVEKIKILPEKENVYSLKVDSECHSFLTNGFVSHNTEVRLSPIALHFLEGLNNDIVDTKRNFDETLKEPTVLPVQFPNLLVNGSSGIAVGMATSIPPHNLSEVCNGVIRYIKNPNITLSQLMQSIKGPDFPTGGLITNKKELNKMYKTGNGRLELRSKVHVEDAGYGRLNFVITEVPYNFAGNKDRLINDIINAADKGILNEVIDIRDESSADGIRIVIETKRGTDEKYFINKLFSKTQAQINYRYDFKAIKDNKPVTMGLLEYIESFVSFQREIYTKNYNFLLKQLQDRQEILLGLIEAYDKIDAVIEAIKGSKNIATARECLMKGQTNNIKFKRKTMENIAKKFNFTENQANAILQMKLQRLVAIEKDTLTLEIKNINKEIINITNILEKPEKLDMEIIKTLEKIQKKYKANRKTEIKNDELEEFVEEFNEEEVYVLYDKDGYLKTIDQTSYNRANKETFKNYYFIEKVLNTETIFFFTKFGDLHQIDIVDIPKVRINDKGENIYNLFDIKNDKVIKVMIKPNKKDKILFLTKQGFIKIVYAEELFARNKTVKSTKLRKNDYLLKILPILDNTHIALITNDGYILKFLIEDIPINGKNAIGSLSVKFNNKKKNFLLDATIFKDSDKIILEYQEDGDNKIKNKNISSMDTKKRNQKGVQLTNKSFSLTHLN